MKGKMETVVRIWENWALKITFLYTIFLFRVVIYNFPQFKEKHGYFSQFHWYRYQSQKGEKITSRSDYTW